MNNNNIEKEQKLSAYQFLIKAHEDFLTKGKQFDLYQQNQKLLFNLKEVNKFQECLTVCNSLSEVNEKYSEEYESFIDNFSVYPGRQFRATGVETKLRDIYYTSLDTLQQAFLATPEGSELFNTDEDISKAMKKYYPTRAKKDPQEGSANNNSFFPPVNQQNNTELKDGEEKSMEGPCQ